MKDTEGRNVTWRAAAVGLAVFYALVVLMNAPAMEKNAENMDRLDFLRRGAARVRGRWLDQENSLQ